MNDYDNFKHMKELETNDALLKSYEEYKKDKKNWGKGPWQTEPDYEEFVYKGYKCEVRRNIVGCWCGYVAVPRIDEDYDDIIDVYGGITYAQEHDGIFWIGFDTAHYNDYWPGTEADLKFIYKELLLEKKINDHLKYLFGDSGFRTYKTLEFVKDECKKIVEQLIDRENHEKALIISSNDTSK